MIQIWNRTGGCGFFYLAALVLLAVTPVVAAPAPAADGDRLQATFIDGIVPGDTTRIAVRWKGGSSEALLDIWVDFDADGSWSDEFEHVVVGVPLIEEIQVFTLQIPADATTDCRTSVRFRVTELAGGVWESTEAVLESNCIWESGFEYTDLQDTVHALALYDDGNGAALYVGGRFVNAGATGGASYIARWDGGEWLPLDGSTGSGTDNTVRSLAVHDDGSGQALYAGGYFTTAGGVTVNGIARWDGSEWSALAGPSGTGMASYPVFALAEFDDGSGTALYAAGNFSAAGGVTVNNIARWDGSGWSALTGPSGTGLGWGGASVRALVEYDDGSGAALYAAGGFSRAGGKSVSNIARWDGTEWSALVGSSGEGVGPSATSLVVFDDGSGPGLYVGGSFGVAAGSLDIKRVARWDGSDWSGLTGWPDHLYDTVNSLEVFDDGSGPVLYAAGVFTSTYSGVTLNRVARYDGSQWTAVTGPAGNGTDGEVTVLAALDPGGGEVLFAAGSFRNAGGVLANRIASWDGMSWAALPVVPHAGLDDEVEALVVYDDGGGPALYAGGSFTEASGAVVSHVARWGGTVWTALTGPSGTGTDGPVSALAVYDDGGGEALYAGGLFNTAGGITVNRIARWDGSGWSALTGSSGTGTSYEVHSLAVYDDGGGEALYAGGGFNTAGGVTVNGIARWDGSEWSALTGPSGTGAGSVHALAVYDDGGGEALYAGGSFDTAGGVNVNDVAKWDGTAWYGLYGPLGVGMTSLGGVFSLAVYDDGSGAALYAGGSFSHAGGVEVFRIARWDGGEWSALVGPFGPGMNDRVDSLLVYDSGAGNELYVGGEFSIAGGVTVNRVARWDGIGFSALNGPPDTGVGPDGSVLALAEYNDGSGSSLYVGGSFTVAGGSLSHRIAKWSCISEVFSDGFESGGTSRWSSTTP